MSEREKNGEDWKWDGRKIYQKVNSQLGKSTFVWYVLVFFVVVRADPAPSLEIEFWDSLAEAFLRYYGKAITLKVISPNLSRIGQITCK